MAEAKNGMIWVLGLTGGIASGKSSASSFLASLGAKVVDADKISRDVTAPGGVALPAIREAFGDEVFNEDGTLNRRELGRRVFESDALRRTLEGIIHPLVQQQTLARIRELAEQGETSVVLDVPLLYETGMDVLCDEVWLMAVPEEEQVNRVMERGLSEDEALSRIQSQMDLEQKQALCDRVIWTNHSIQITQRELEGLWQNWVRRIERERRAR